MSCPLLWSAREDAEGVARGVLSGALCEAELRSSLDGCPLQGLALRVVTGQQSRPVKDSERGVGVAVHSHVDLHVMAAVTIRWDLEHAPLDLVNNLAVAVVSEAIRNSVRYATTVGDVPGIGEIG